MRTKRNFRGGTGGVCAGGEDGVHDHGPEQALGAGWEQEAQRGVGSIARLAFLLSGGGRLRAAEADMIPAMFAQTWGRWGATERARRAGPAGGAWTGLRAQAGARRSQQETGGLGTATSPQAILIIFPRE